MMTVTAHFEIIFTQQLNDSNDKNTSNIINKAPFSEKERFNSDLKQKLFKQTVILLIQSKVRLRC